MLAGQESEKLRGNVRKLLILNHNIEHVLIWMQIIFLKCCYYQTHMKMYAAE